MKDTGTKILLQVINILFLYNVTGTSYGVLVGLIILGCQDLITTFFPIFGLIKWYGFIAIGILIFNIKPFVKKEYVDPKMEKQLRYVREVVKEGNFSDKEKRMIWRKTINSIIIGPTETNTSCEDSSNNWNSNVSG